MHLLMKFSLKILLPFIALFIQTSCFTQPKLPSNTKDPKSLEERINETQKLLQVDVEKANHRIDQLLKEAINSNNKNAETLLLANKCRYYFHKEDAFGLIRASNILYEKSLEYHNRRMQSLSKMYLAEAFKFNGLYDDALIELKHALFLIEKEDSLDINIINSRSNIYISYANTYAHLKKPRIAVEMMMKGGDEFNRVPKGEYYKG